MQSQFKIEEISCNKLSNVYNNFKAIDNILTYISFEADRRLKTDNKFLEAINFPFIGLAEGKSKFNSVKLKFSEITDSNRENSILNLVANFEKVVFDKIKISSSKIKDKIENNYSEDQPMHSFRTSFIKNEEDIFNLTKFNIFLEKHKVLKDELDEIINFRNYLAHGKRHKVGNPSNKTLEQIIVTLDNIIKLL